MRSARTRSTPRPFRADNPRFSSSSHRKPIMGNKIKTEADRRATPPLPGSRTSMNAGQRVSLERGSHTRSKKNPGKRPSKGG